MFFFFLTLSTYSVVNSCVLGIPLKQMQFFLLKYNLLFTYLITFLTKLVIFNNSFTITLLNYILIIPLNE